MPMFKLPLSGDVTQAIGLPSGSSAWRHLGQGLSPSVAVAPANFAR